jgi:hypothetical protein
VTMIAEVMRSGFPAYLSETLRYRGLTRTAS